MKRIVEPLNQMGAHVQATMDCAPLTVLGHHPLRGIHYEMPIASAQVKSAILLAGLNAIGRTEVVEPNPTRDHTERLLRWFGVVVNSETIGPTDKTRTTIEGPCAFEARDIAVPGDISSAAFFIAAAALLPGSELQITNVGLNPTRTRFLLVLQLLGALIEIRNLRDECNERIGDVHVRGRSELEPQKPHANLIRGSLIPQLIDELPILAVLGTRVRDGIKIYDAKELRVKESDRIATTVRNLRAMGAEVEEFEDGLTVNGPCQLQGAALDSFGDHRIAMAFTVAALIATGVSEIKDADCVRVSCPEFFKLVESVCIR
jgi:3-phosphoshikimate 1-carboxyvinyltransferase